jgi:tRNA G46 methylase TrmB
LFACRSAQDLVRRILACGSGAEFRWRPQGEEPLIELLNETWIEMVYGSTAQRGQTIVDIGADVGVFTVFAASRSPHARIIAVEPTPRSYGYLCSNAKRNRLGNVIPLQAACGASRGRPQSIGVEAKP